MFIDVEDELVGERVEEVELGGKVWFLKIEGDAVGVVIVDESEEHLEVLRVVTLEGEKGVVVLVFGVAGDLVGNLGDFV